jgi:hypothetical protein
MHSTPIRLAEKQHTPKSAAGCARSNPASPKVRAATEVDSKTTNVDVAAATCGWTPNCSSSGEMIMPPDIPRRPAALHLHTLRAGVDSDVQKDTHYVGHRELACCDAREECCKTHTEHAADCPCGSLLRLLPCAITARWRRSSARLVPFPVLMCLRVIKAIRKPHSHAQSVHTVLLEGSMTCSAW